jgi:flagella basal body P-ring formation protein FlgA
MAMRSLLVVFAVVGVITFPTRPLAASPTPADGENVHVPADQPVVLRDVAMVGGNLVRVGDLFINAGEKAFRAVGYAPAPGRRMTFDARTLYRLARAHGLDWTPMSLHDKAVIQRESVVVSGAEVADSILAALPDRGIDTDGVEVELNNPMLKLHLPVDATETVTVEGLSYSAGNGRFSAILTIPADGLSVRQVRVAGRVHRVAPVPVLANRVMRGDVINERDIEWLQLRSSRIPHNTVLDAASLVGFSPKRTLRPGVPVRISEVQQPVLVAKGAHVTLVLETPSMMLTARGRALQNGGRGDIVQVTNAQSHTVVEGVVTGAGTVAVSPSGAVAIN